MQRADLPRSVLVLGLDDGDPDVRDMAKAMWEIRSEEKGGLFPPKERLKERSVSDPGSDDDVGDSPEAKFLATVTPATFKRAISTPKEAALPVLWQASWEKAMSTDDVVVLKQLATSTESVVRYEVAKNRATPLEWVKKLLGDSSLAVVLAASRHVSWSALDVETQRKMAFDPATTPALHRVLSASAWPEVREAVARATVDLEILETLTRDEAIMVRWSVAKREAITSSMWEVLVGDRSVEVRAALGTNRNVPLSVLRKLLGDKQISPRLAVISQADRLEEEDLQQLSKDPDFVVRGHLAVNLPKGHSILKALASDENEIVRERAKLWLVQGEPWPRISLRGESAAGHPFEVQSMERRWYAEDPSTSPALLSELGESSEEETLVAVANNPGTPKETREALLRYADLPLRASLAPVAERSLVSDGKEALTRVAASQLGRLVQSSVLGVLGRSDAMLARRAAELLRTELGKGFWMAVLSVSLSLGGSQWPVAWQEGIQKLARELRLGALSSVTDELLMLVTAPVQEALFQATEGGARREVLELEGARSAIERPETVVLEEKVRS
jgi:hypothetical protein